MPRGGNYANHSFYCISCGNVGIPIMRKQGQKRGSMHRKRLYCVHCRQDVNHIECKNQDEIEEFRLNFQNGVYKEEAEKSLLLCHE